MPCAGSQRTRAQTSSQPRSQTQSQSQPQRRQTRGSQARRQTQARRKAEEDDEDDADADADEDENEEANGDEMDVDADLRQGDVDGDLARRANDLVRLALFNEHKRTPLRRDEISKKVMGSNTRAFNRVFAQAQETLRKVFGMELVELRSRAELDREEEQEGAGGAEDALGEAQRATVVKKKSSASGSKTYILRSVLDPVIIEQASQTYAELLEAETRDLVEDVSDDDDDDTSPPVAYGSIIAWNNSEEMGPTGFLYVILAIILVSGRVLGDNDLRAYLKQLKLPLSQGHLNFSERSTQSVISVDAYLSQLLRQGYLDRRKAGEGKGGKGKKRGRMTQEDDPNAMYEWRWGNRAQSEVGEDDIAGFIAGFLGGEDEEDEEEGGRPGRRGRNQHGETKYEKIFKGVQRAAGGELAAAR